jgi:hypothetical protein
MFPEYDSKARGPVSDEVGKFDVELDAILLNRHVNVIHSPN